MTDPAARLPNLDALKGFEAAARLGSFTRAAEELCLTQSAVSRQVQTLEQQLGQRLFLRGTRRIALTEAGEELYAAARAALERLAQAALQIRRRGQRSTVTVSTTPGIASLWLVPRLPRFQARHPDIDVRIDASLRLVDLAHDGIDLALRYLPQAAAPAGAVKLFAEEVLAVCSPGLRRAHRHIAPDRLEEVVLLQYDAGHGEYPWLNWGDWLRAQGVEQPRPRAWVRFNQYDQLIAAAVAGQGLALGRGPLVAQLLREKKLARAFGDALAVAARGYFLLRGPAADRPAVARFADWLLEEAGETHRPA